MVYLRQAWSKSRLYRAAVIAAAVYALLRLVVQGVLIVGLTLSGATEGYDLQLIVDASTHILLKQDLYPPAGKLERAEFYQYSPAYALAFIPFSLLPLPILMVILTLAHLAAYGLLYLWWDRIFHQLHLDHAREMLAWTLPVWLVSSSFWGDLGYLNIYILMALLSTLLIEAILSERLGWSLLWLTLILQAKPQWAFAAAVPLFLGRGRFFAKLIGPTILAYGAIMGATILTVGPTFGWRQYVEYFRLLATMSYNFPYRGPDAPFLGYNHSVIQTVVYLLGMTPTALRLATGIKVLLLLPLAVVGVRYLLRPVRLAGHVVPQLALDWAFALYLGAFIWLDMVWELSLGIPVFTYLLATLRRRITRILVCIVFLPYALLDIWRLLSVATLGPSIVLPGPFILTDPGIYVPLIMIIILTFYVLLLIRLVGQIGNPAAVEFITQPVES